VRESRPFLKILIKDTVWQENVIPVRFFILMAFVAMRKDVLKLGKTNCISVNGAETPLNQRKKVKSVAAIPVQLPFIIKNVIVPNVILNKYNFLSPLRPRLSG
jgi:hypothetical protein